MTKEKKDSALVFVGQIMTAYKAAMRVEGEALKAAMECGKYLNLAKENVKADKGKWLPWLKQNCPEISQQTASLYMRLADPENLDKLVGVKTIRDADAALRKSSRDDAGGDDDGDSNSDDADDSDDNNAAGQTNNALLKSKPASPDLTELIKNTGVDEVGKALADADKLEDFEAAAIKRMSPDKLYNAVIKAWDVDEVRELSKQLTAYLNTLGPSPQRDLNIPAALRRPLTQPAQSTS
jgi:hypothetical protein